MRIRDVVRSWLGIESLIGSAATARRDYSDLQTSVWKLHDRVIEANNVLGELHGGIAAIMKRLDALESTLANLSIATEASAKAPVRPIYAPVMNSDWEALQAAGMKEFEEK